MNVVKQLKNQSTADNLFCIFFNVYTFGHEKYIFTRLQEKWATVIVQRIFEFSRKKIHIWFYNLTSLDYNTSTFLALLE